MKLSELRPSTNRQYWSLWSPIRSLFTDLSISKRVAQLSTCGASPFSSKANCGKLANLTPLLRSVPDRTRTAQLAEVGTLQIEWGYLSYITGNMSYHMKVNNPIISCSYQSMRISPHPKLSHEALFLLKMGSFYTLLPP